MITSTFKIPLDTFSSNHACRVVEETKLPDTNESKPDSSTINSQTCVELKLEHFGQLLGELLVIHRNKQVHRDIRFANILLNGDRAVFGDLGSAQLIDSRTPYAGSRETASNRIMEAKVAHNDSRPGEQFEIDFRAEDDLESLYKVFLMWLVPASGREINEANSTSGYLKIWKYYFHFFDQNVPKSAADWATYLGRIFNYTE